MGIVRIHAILYLQAIVVLDVERRIQRCETQRADKQNSRVQCSIIYSTRMCRQFISEKSSAQACVSRALMHSR